MRPLTLQDAGDDAAPTSSSYIVDITIAGVVVAPGFGALPAANFTYTAAARYAHGPGVASFRVRGGQNIGLMGAFVSCLQAQQVDVIFTGFGFTFGQYFGGITA